MDDGNRRKGPRTERSASPRDVPGSGFWLVGTAGTEMQGGHERGGFGSLSCLYLALIAQAWAPGTGDVSARAGEQEPTGALACPCPA